ncbi:ParA family protein [Thermochromatium tepidum]|uniref:AAA family ATPase n=1 Tax=Thermochromatium tepidum ATCC 43061 TaxID=316276 RepID=A0A6I6EAW7_THETI|nr:ParA family protein [Thermochromatium tepidum]QGU33863.1 AAA family ATPase [Thermochromatium tepidum ATCC 43061]
MMHSLVVSNRKGGTGKTTVAVNVAAELAARGRRVLLIDLDSQGHCAVGLGVKVGAGTMVVHRLFTDSAARLSDAIGETAYPNLWLAPADPRFDHSTVSRNDQRLREAIAVEGLVERFDCLIIDTPPSLDVLLMNALLAATRVLVPYVPHQLSFEGTRQLIRVLYPIMTRHNRALKILGFVPMMAAEHVRQHRAVTGNVSHEFGATKLLPAIRSDIRLAEAMAAGKPIRTYAPKSRGAEDFAALAEEIVARLT